MTISAEVIKDSLNTENKRLTSLRVVMPKSFLAQYNTHRVFSRNFSSSRAIPVKKVIESVLLNPVIPIWTRNQPGMVGELITDEQEIAELTADWLEGRDRAVEVAEKLAAKGGHKQSVNRMLEPYMFAQGVTTATEFSNFMFLRTKDAQPEIMVLAQAMQAAMAESTPTLVNVNDWHMPYILPEEELAPLKDRLRVSVARVARTSYKTFDNNKVSEFDKDVVLFEDLLREMHLSPFESQARSTTKNDPNIDKMRGNFHGSWAQLRKGIELGAW